MRRMYSQKQLEELIQATKKDIATLVDKDGHERFIEGEVKINESLTGATITYAKWSLSGSHLLIVVAGNSKEDDVFGAYNPLVSIEDLPDWVLNKIAVVFGSSYIEQKQISMYAEDWSTQTFYCLLGKDNNGLFIRKTGSTTLTTDKGFRIAFDLLIDND